MVTINKIDRGFISWKGERLFVPWFGAIRIVPTAEGEVSLLKLRERAHRVMGLAFLPLFFVGLGLAVWTGVGTDHSVLSVMIGLVAIFGLCGLIERNRTRHWPIFAMNQNQFWISLYRSLPRSELRLSLAVNAIAALFCVSAFVTYIVDFSPLTIAAFFGPAPLAVLACQGTACALVALVRRSKTLNPLP